ncbi:hypothetical protein [Fervidobacterium changbaicum]|uniref:hypothetical protein n=1 Tax=Fervidobacterium changbaicum TaxID=310769 RepID=UPI0013E95C12|nr:hypothetical protein [Fervidobacterium changbaicum]
MKFETGIKLVVTASSVDVPHISGVKNLISVWYRNLNELRLTWEYNEIGVYWFDI